MLVWSDIQHTCQPLLFVVLVLVREQERLMASLILLFIVILTTVSKVTSLHCSDQQLPASGDDDLQQVTTLHYCQVDNCTIIRLDTGEELDIVYTTNSVIVTTPTDGSTSMMISKDEYAFPCDGNQIQFAEAVLIVASPLIFSVVGGLVVGLVLAFKELHTLFGYLLMLYNVSYTCHCITAAAILLVEFLVAIYSHMLCYAMSMAFALSGFSIEVIGTCLLHNFAYIMYCSEKLYSIQSEDKKRWTKYYIIYYLTNIMIILLVMIGYDMANDNISGIILPNGHCIYIGKHLHDTLRIPVAAIGISKTVQLMLFITYLYYTYQINKDVTNPAILDSQKFLQYKIGLAMGAVVGLTFILYFFVATIEINVVIINLIGFCLSMAQQCSIIAILLCSKEMRHKYRKCLTKD